MESASSLLRPLWLAEKRGPARGGEREDGWRRWLKSAFNLLSKSAGGKFSLGFGKIRNCRSPKIY